MNADGEAEEVRRPESSVPAEYDADAVEAKWQDRWLEAGTYDYDREAALDADREAALDADREGVTDAESEAAVDADAVFAIDTPPPTVSGDLHLGHLYQFTLQDFVARFHRMADPAVYFPFGYDDNGIASERLTERDLGIRHQEYTRREFQQKCREVCSTYEADFTDEVRSLAISVDWSNTYKTIDRRVQRVSQLSFLDLYERGREYRRRAPTIWCPDCETAISQVEQEDADRDAHFNDIAFELVEAGDGATEGADDGTAEDSEHTTGGTVTISTTRPELLPACVAVFVHPDDEDNRHLVGGRARVPLFGQEVPILEDDRVDVETGSGVVMCCTFGDRTDVEWYQAHDLPLRLAIDESGTMTDVADGYEGMTTGAARAAIVEDLEAEGHLEDRRDHRHTVQVHERCEVEVEYLVTEQWYVKLLDKKAEYLAAGREMEWFPEKMFARYEHWIEGLEWDWCISRQRDSGIPIPVWYCGDCGEVVVADREQLPVDPLQDDPPVDACPACGGEAFEPDEDVFDTWATSSLTPLINAGWGWDGESGAFTMEHPELYPFDLRPQGHDIISFWLFHTVVKCYEHTGEVPFDSVMINGMVLDENREAMSKSKGNVVTPDEVLGKFPVDAARYWAAGTSIGDDFPYKEGDLEGGTRLLQKLWNASRLVDQLTPPAEEVPDVGGDPAPGDRAAGDVEQPAPDDLAPVDRWLLAELDAAVDSLTGKLRAYEFSKARDELRAFFWNTFCDDYLEVAKQRLDGERDPSTEYALVTAHRTFLKLFAPFLPHVTEELHRRLYAGGDAGDADAKIHGEAGDADAKVHGDAGDAAAGAAFESIHVSAWPEPRGYEADLAAGETAMEVVAALRRYKTDRGLALNADLDRVEVYGDVAGFEAAIAETMHVADLRTVEEAPQVTTDVVGVDLEYSLVGPEFGDRVPDIEAAIEDGEFEVRDGRLHAAGVELDPGMFAVEERHTYSGAGEMVETDSAVVVVR